MTQPPPDAGGPPPQWYRPVGGRYGIRNNSQPGSAGGQHPPHPQFQPAPPQPARPLTRTGRTLIWILAGLVAFVSVFFGVRGVVDMVSDAQALRVGSCIAVDEWTGNVDYRKIDCSDASQYSYLVTEFLKGEVQCTDDMASSITLSTETRFGDFANSTSCLIPNFHADRCYTEHEVDLHEYQLAECSAADFRIAKVADEPTISCDPDSGPYEFPRAGRSYCVAEAG